MYFSIVCVPSKFDKWFPFSFYTYLRARCHPTATTFYIPSAEQWTRRRLGYCSHGQLLASGVTPLSILRGRKRNSVRMQDVCNYSVRGAAVAFVVQYIVQDVLWVTGLLLRQWKAANSWASERNVNAVMCVSTVQPLMSRLHFFV